MSHIPPPFDLAALLSPTDTSSDQQSRHLHYAYQQPTPALQTNLNGLVQPNLTFSPGGQVPHIPANSWTNSALPQPHGTLNVPPPYATAQYHSQPVLTSLHSPQNAPTSSVPLAPPYPPFAPSQHTLSMPINEGREEGELSDDELAPSQALPSVGRLGETSYSPRQTHGNHRSMYGTGSSWRPGLDHAGPGVASRTPPNRQLLSQKRESINLPSPRSATFGYDTHRPSDTEILHPPNSRSDAFNFRNSSANRRPSATNGADQSPVSPRPSNGISNEYLVEQKERAKRSLLQFYRNNIGFKELVKEGLDASHLADIYQEIGIATAEQKNTTTIASLDSDSEAYDPAAPALAIRNTSGSDPRPSFTRKYSTSKSATAAPSPLETSSAAATVVKQKALPESSESPMTPVGNAETSSPSAKQQTAAASRDSYIARLKAAKIKPKTPADPPSPSSTTPALQAQDESTAKTTSELVEQQETTKPTAEKVKESVAINTPDSSRLLTSPTSPSLIVDNTSDTLVEAPKPVVSAGEPVNSDERRQAELARLKRSALESIKLKRVKSDTMTSNAPQSSTASTLVTPELKLKDGSALSDGTDSARADQKYSNLEATEVNRVVPTPTTPFGRIPGLTVTPTSAIAKSTISEGGLPESKAISGVQRKRPVAADFAFDNEEPSNKRPFGDVRSGDENEGIIIEASDDETASTGRDATPLLASSDRRANKPTIGSYSDSKSSVRYGPVDSLLQEVLTSTGERAVSTGPTSTSDKDDRPDLRRREQEIQQMKQRIAEMERKRKAKAISSRTPTPSATQSDTSRAFSPNRSEKHNVSRPSQHSAVTSISQGPDLETARAASNRMPVSNPSSPAGPNDSRSEWLQRRREEIKQGIPALDADFANKSSQMELLREQMRQLEESMQKDSEDKQRLVEELEALGIDTEGMAHSTMQDVKNDIVARQEAEDNSAVSQIDQSSKTIDSHEDLYERSPSSDVQQLGFSHENDDAEDEAEYPESASSMSMSSDDESPSATDPNLLTTRQQGDENDHLKATAYSHVEGGSLNQDFDALESQSLFELRSYGNDVNVTSGQLTTAPEETNEIPTLPESQTEVGLATQAQPRENESGRNTEAMAAEQRLSSAEFDRSAHYDELEPDFYMTSDDGKELPNDHEPSASSALSTADLQNVQEVEIIKSESPDQPVHPVADRESSRLSEDDLDDLYGSDTEDIQPQLPAQQPDIDMSDGYDLDSTESEAVAQQQEAGEEDMDLSEESDYEPLDSTIDESAMRQSNVQSEEEEEGEYEPPEASVSLRGGENDEVLQSTPAAASKGSSLPLSPEEGEVSDELPEDVDPRIESDDQLDEPANQTSGNDPYLTHDDRFTPYESSLRRFNAYRNHPEFSINVPGGHRSLTYSNEIDKILEICPSEVADGVCSDPHCHYQHLRSMGITDESLLVQLGNSNPGRDENEQRMWHDRLSNKLEELRQRNVQDAESIATEIIALRRTFLDLGSRDSIFDFMS